MKYIRKLLSLKDENFLSLSKDEQEKKVLEYLKEEDQKIRKLHEEDEQRKILHEKLVDSNLINIKKTNIDLGPDEYLVHHKS
jgi:uncharacterized membrane-anchored protein